MKTKSVWGEPPSRLYRMIDRLIKEKKPSDIEVCIVGCSDGKFVLPFARKGIKVDCYDIDPISINGGYKEFPVNIPKTKEKYIKSNYKPVYEKVESETKYILGLNKRLEKEGLSEFVKVNMKDFFNFKTHKKYSLIFTSCSIQYKSNLKTGIKSIMNSLKEVVDINGYLYMDYMMPLEDSHYWKSELFLRTGQIYTYFDENWEIIHVKEMKEPVFEAAHVGRPSNHFHRFGYILARRIKNV